MSHKKKKKKNFQKVLRYALRHKDYISLHLHCLVCKSCRNHI